MDNMKQISLISYSGSNTFRGEVNIDFDKFHDLSEDARNHISYKASRFLEEFRENISMAWAKEHEADEREKHVSELTKMFKLAGFDPIYVETIDNEYGQGSYYYKCPWIIATTSKGRIKLGWRKRVIKLDWSDSDLNINGEELFKEEDTTRGKNYIHCWGGDKAIEYLKKLNEK